MSSLTMIQQAVKLRELLPQMKMRVDGAPAERVFFEIDQSDHAFLIGIAERLERMSVHEPAIRRLVTRR